MVRIPGGRAWLRVVLVAVAGVATWIAVTLFEELVTADMRWGLWAASAVKSGAFPHCVGVRGPHQAVDPGRSLAQQLVQEVGANEAGAARAVAAGLTKRARLLTGGRARSCVAPAVIRSRRNSDW
jgi:hypothetical protein